MLLISRRSKAVGVCTGCVLKRNFQNKMLRNKKLQVVCESTTKRSYGAINHGNALMLTVKQVRHIPFWSIYFHVS